MIAEFQITSLHSIKIEVFSMMVSTSYFHTSQWDIDRIIDCNKKYLNVHTEQCCKTWLFTMIAKFKLYHYTVGQTHDYLPLLENFKLQNYTIGQKHDYQPWL